VGCERPGARAETYSVQLLDSEGDEHGCDLDEDDWMSMDVGSRWSGDFRMIGGGVVCSSLEPL
jgi:hypothetical protein